MTEQEASNMLCRLAESIELRDVTIYDSAIAVLHVHINYVLSSVGLDPVVDRSLPDKLRFFARLVRETEEGRGGIHQTVIAAVATYFVTR